LALVDGATNGANGANGDGAAAKAKAAAPAAPTAPAPAKPAVATPGPAAPAPASAAQVAPAQAPPAPAADAATPGKIVHASPGVRRFARELGVPLGEVTGSGPKNRILKEDIQSFVKQSLSGGASTR